MPEDKEAPLVSLPKVPLKFVSDLLFCMSRPQYKRTCGIRVRGGHILAASAKRNCRPSHARLSLVQHEAGDRGPASGILRRQSVEEPRDQEQY